MSRENVDAVLEAFAAWNRGDRQGWIAQTHPDVEWFSAVLREIEGKEGVVTGHAGLGRFWDEWHSLWNLTIEPSDVHDLGQTVLVLAQLRTTGKASGAETARSVGYLFEFDGGLIRRSRAYLSTDEAVAAAGLKQD
jgi:ketosteroid isomerase-like protein